MPSKTCDAAVIGGGPAGSAAAIQLAGAGNQVSLLERKQGAHHKVCGEFISWEAARYLMELGIDLPALGAQPVNWLRLVDSEAMLETALPFEAWSLSRYRLDAALLKAAEQAGVTVERGAGVRALSPRKAGWTLETGKQLGLSANAVFLASGKHDVHNWRRQRRRIPDLIGLKMHLQLSEVQQNRLRDSVEIHLFDGGYAGLEPVENGKANLCFLVSKAIYMGCGKNWSRLLSWLCQTSSHMQTRLAGSTSLWPQPLAVYGTPYGYLHQPPSTASTLFRLGDQMAVIPSFAGDGIAIALHSAALATRIHASGEHAKRYYQQARRDFRRPVRNAQMLASLLSCKPGKKIAFQLARQWPGFMASAICRIRLEKV